jgi:hypothetical protein
MLRHYDFVSQQIEEVIADRTQALADKSGHFPHAEKVQLLATLGAVGETTATVLVAEVYHRSFESRRHVASFVGLAPSPYNSGDTDRNRGINKAGTKLARQTLVELAWFWLRYQPQSKLSLWWHERFGGPKTGEPHPRHKVYPYLLRHLAIERPNQVCPRGLDATPRTALTFGPYPHDLRRFSAAKSGRNQCAEK